MDESGTIHFNNLNANAKEEFIEFGGDVLNIDISGTNSITCSERSYAIDANGNLKLSGNGTLTITVGGDECYGLWAKNYDFSDQNNSDPSVLAADGYTVTRSGVTDNGDDMYTWTYTVTPISGGQ